MMTYPLMVPCGSEGDSMDRLLLRCIEVLSCTVLVLHIVSTASAATTRTGSSTASIGYVGILQT